MTNAFYNPSGVPGPKAFGSSAAIRAEFSAIGAAFNLFPSSFVGKGGYFMRLNPGATEFDLVDPAGLGDTFLPATGGTVTGSVAVGTSVNIGALSAAGSYRLAVAGTLVFDARAAINGVVGAGNANDNFTVDTNKVLNNYGLAWKTFSDAPSGPSAALSGFGGIRQFTNGAQRVITDGFGNTVFGTAGSVPAALVTLRTANPILRFQASLRDYAIGVSFANGGPDLSFYDYTAGQERLRITDTGKIVTNPAGRSPAGDFNIRKDTSGDGPQLVLSNEVSNGAVRKYGALLFQNFRDVASPVFGAGVWAEGASGAGYTSDLVFGTSANLGSNAYPNERLRLTSNGLVGINNSSPTYRLDSREDAGGAKAFRFWGAGLASLFGYVDAIGSGISNADPHAGGSLVYMTGTETQMYTGGALRLRLNNSGLSDGNGRPLGYRNMPRNTAYGQLGEVSAISNNVTLNTGETAGNAYGVYNTADTPISFFAGGGLTLRLAGTNNVGTRTIGPHGFATIWVNSASEYIMGGAGVS